MKAKLLLRLPFTISKTGFKFNLQAASRFLSSFLVLLLLLICGTAQAQNYTITTTGGNLVITDNSNNGETIAISQNSSNIRFVVTPTTRTYSINGGATTAFTTPADIALSGITSITVNAAGGDDNITVAAFTANLPSMTINGGTGNEIISLNGDITFAANANLDLDLQNDVGSPGTDAVILANSTNLLLSGTGAATVKVSQYLAVNAGASIETVNGNLTAEANQQAASSSGDFDGVYVDGTNSKLSCSGTGTVSILGKSGTSSTSFGVAARNGGKFTSNSGDITVIGTGGNSDATLNYGVWVTGTNSAISSAGGNVNVTGTGGGSGGSNTNLGVVVQGPSASITSSVGNVSVTGIGGLGASSIGIVTQSSGTITTTGGGSITLSATSMNLTAAVNAGGGGSVTLKSTDNILIDLGTSANTLGGPLGISDAELDLVTGSSIVIGHALAGNITVSAAITHASSNISLVSGGDITISGGSFSSGTGTLLLDCGVSPKAVKPIFSGTDVTASTLSFGSDLAIVINGTTVDVQYTQLNVAGAVNLSGVDLVLSGSHTPVVGQTFLIVANDGTDPITGTFNGLPEGATIPNFLGSSLSATISYLGIGGGGNDVLLTVGAALPVELVSFSGKNTPAGNLLEWHTASEQNNEGFEVERSIDGSIWKMLDFVPGNGTTQAEQSYSFVDERPMPGTNYYRLRQVDFDGNFEYSEVRSVDFRNIGGFRNLAVYPNPVSQGELKLYFPDEPDENTSLRIYSTAGQLVLRQPVQSSGNSLDVSGLAPGIYLLEVTNGAVLWQERVVVQRP